MLILKDPQAERRKAFAQSLMQQSQSNAPVQHWTQGANRIAQALLGAYMGKKADKQEADRRKNIMGQISTAMFPEGPMPDGSAMQPRKGTDLINALSGIEGIDNEALSMMQLQQNMKGGGQPSSVQEWEYYNSLKPDDQKRYLEMKRQNKWLDTGTGYVIAPGVGEAVPSPQPEGSAPAAGVVTKDIAGAEKEKVTGQAAGEAETVETTRNAKDIAESRAKLKRYEANFPATEKMVESLRDLSNKATSTIVGKGIDWASQQAGFGATEGAKALTEYKSIVANNLLPLLRQTFGAAFTAEEGQRLLATLGDHDKTPEERNSALDAFIAQKREEMETERRFLGEGGEVKPKSDEDILKEYL